MLTTSNVVCKPVPTRTALTVHNLFTILILQTLSLAVRFYIRSVELQPDNGSLWHDLGIAFFRQAQNETDEGRAVDAARKSVNVNYKI